MVIKIMSGGQTGVDRAALDAALANDIACGGWCPKGRMADDGPIDAKYSLLETEAGIRQSTEANVRDADGTLILSFGGLSPSTVQTAAVTRRLFKPTLVIDMNKSPSLEEVEKWAEDFRLRILNITGPRASEVADAYDRAREFLRLLLAGEEGK